MGKKSKETPSTTKSTKSKATTTKNKKSVRDPDFEDDDQFNDNDNDENDDVLTIDKSDQETAPSKPRTSNRKSTTPKSTAAATTTTTTTTKKKQTAAATAKKKKKKEEADLFENELNIKSSRGNKNNVYCEIFLFLFKKTKNEKQNWRKRRLVANLMSPPTMTTMMM